MVGLGFRRRRSRPSRDDNGSRRPLAAAEPARIEVRQGDIVELVLRSADTDHGLAIKAYAVKVAIPKGGDTVGVSFVASRAGTFPIECSEYCGSGHKRMKGELVVTETAQ
jgi:heme/copper-type cytochrome/quinol oxidase subunit 2